MVGLFDIEDATYRTQGLVMFERKEKMWSSHLGYMKSVAHHIDLKLVTRILYQHPFHAGLQRREIIEKHINKMLVLDVIEQAQSDWASPIFIAPKKDGTARFCVDFRKLNDFSESYPTPPHGRLHG